MEKVYLVWNDDEQEGVVFGDYKDARFAATGETECLGVSLLAYNWREKNAENEEQYEIRAVVL